MILENIYIYIYIKSLLKILAEEGEKKHSIHHNQSVEF